MKKWMIFEDTLFNYVLIRHSDKNENGTIEITDVDGSRIAVQKQPNKETSVFVEGNENTIKKLLEILPPGWEKRKHSIQMDEP